MSPELPGTINNFIGDWQLYPKLTRNDTIYLFISDANSLLKGLVEQAGKRFINKLSAKVKKGAVRVLGRNPSVTLEIKDPSVVTFEQHAKESYTIDVTSNPGEVSLQKCFTLHSW